MLAGHWLRAGAKSSTLTLRMYSWRPATPNDLMTNQTFSERKRLDVGVCGGWGGWRVFGRFGELGG